MKPNIISNKKKLFVEFLRYSLVGGFSAVLDMGINYCMLFYILGGTKDDKLLVILSVATGFILGLCVNFLLSNIFVFKSESQKKEGKNFKAFLIYGLVGLIGLFITEVLTIVGTKLIGNEGIWYLLLNCVVKMIVLVWNYFGRKIFVYKGK